MSTTHDHLTDEQLSAHIDGAEDEARSGAPVAEEHLACCDVCARRIEELRDARRLVAAPVAAVSQATKSTAVAEAVRTGLRAGDDPAAAFAGPMVAGPAVVETANPGRWYRRPRLLGGAAAALVALGVALPLAISSQSSTSPNPTAARSSSARPNASSAVPGATRQPSAAGSGAAGLNAPAASGAGASAGALPDLGAVSSAQDVQGAVARLGLEAMTSYSPAQSGSAYGLPLYSYSDCVANTRRAADGGPYGPGLVATASYRGDDALVMEFWPTKSSPPAGEAVVAVSSRRGCKLLARTTT